jgi:hypothetical protein
MRVQITFNAEMDEGPSLDQVTALIEAAGFIAPACTGIETIKEEA